VASSTTCSGEWLLPDGPILASEIEEDPAGPLPKPGLKLTGLFVAVVLFGLLIGSLLGSDAPAVATTGEPAPDFTVELIEGGAFTLSEHLAGDDRPIVLNLWASWCIPCQIETPDISAFADANPGVKVIGVAVEDTEAGSRQFAEEFAPAYDLALGTEEFANAYPKLGLPATYIIGSDGIVDQLWNGIVTGEVLSDLVSGS
jgi:cytochrome c biogenesis protein CcmG/thiol:disulfide interchange protein DsbE